MNEIFRNIKYIISNKKNILFIYILLSLFASFQALFTGKKALEKGGIEYNRYNNYTIFEKSFSHLKDGKDLYVLYPQEHWDLYKYSPTFSVFFGIFSIFPDFIGLNLWNLLNVLVFLVSIYYLPKFDDFKKGLILIFCLFELMTSIQNEQSNALIAGLIILAFGFLERDKYFISTFFIVFSIYIKLFGVVAFVLFLFYPKKKKFILYSSFWTILLFLIPLIFIDFNMYKFQLESYWKMLSNDHNISYGFSVMGWLNSWLNIEINKLFVVVIGAITFLIPFIKIKQYNNYYFRILTLVSILLWIVIFNHKAESPTFIIAFAGVSIWFFTSKKSKINLILFVCAIILTSLSSTDIFPLFIRQEIIKPYMLKVFPCILIWIKVIYDMIVLKDDFVEVNIKLIQNNSTNELES